MSNYKGNVLLVVNVASQCGYTDVSYKGLVELDKKYANQGLSILAFPCDQFGGQGKYQMSCFVDNKPKPKPKPKPNPFC